MGKFGETPPDKRAKNDAKEGMQKAREEFDELRYLTNENGERGELIDLSYEINPEVRKKFGAEGNGRKVFPDLVDRANIQLMRETNPDNIDRERLDLIRQVKEKIVNDQGDMVDESSGLISDYLIKRLERFIASINQRLEQTMRVLKEDCQEHPERDRIVQKGIAASMEGPQKEIRVSNVSMEDFIKQCGYEDALRILPKSLDYAREIIASDDSPEDKMNHLKMLMDDINKHFSILVFGGLDILGDTKLEQSN